MNARTTWFWAIIAALLLSLIFAHHRFAKPTASAPVRALPNLKATEVDGVQIRLRGQAEVVRAIRTNDAWRLVRPLDYPAQGASIDTFLKALERLTPVDYITAGELKDRPKADEEYGFADPQASVFLEQGGYRPQILIGNTTGPGDKLFLQVVGIEGIEVVDADFLKTVPRRASDWRDTALLRLRGLAFDRIAITNGAKVLELQRERTRPLWRITNPAINARASLSHIEESLRKLQEMRVTEFVTDEPGADLDSFGLQIPGLQLALSNGTNSVAVLEFGKSLTNDAAQVYGRRAGQHTVTAQPKAPLEAWWRASVAEFRDPHLVSSTDGVEVVEVRGEDNFTLARQTNNAWRVLPGGFVADTELMQQFLEAWTSIEVVEFVKDAVTPADLPEYGLKTPSRTYVLRAGPVPVSGGSTNPALAELCIGTNRDDKVYVGRADESSVYAVKAADLQPLPSAGYQLRDRSIWDVPLAEVANVTIHQGGKTRKLVHEGAHHWSLAPGSQGEINAFAVEESVRYLCRLSAEAWAGRGTDAKMRSGINAESQEITLQFKSGKTLTVAFQETPTLSVYGTVVLEEEPWVFNYSQSLYRFIGTYLNIPANVP